LISYVKDRPGHDLYAIDANKINKELGWSPSVTFEQGWKNGELVLENENWLNNITSGEYATLRETIHKISRLITDFTE
jgi:dTDP-glucose 4,6-dehydratase